MPNFEVNRFVFSAPSYQLDKLYFKGHRLGHDCARPSLRGDQLENGVLDKEAFLMLKKKVNLHRDNKTKKKTI